jgi:hypothetical protein
MRFFLSIIALLLSWHISYASCNGRFVNPDYRCLLELHLSD